MNIKLVLPSEDFKEKVLNYKADFIKNSDSMDGTAGLENAQTFEEWFDAWKDNLSEETVHDGLVPATTFLAVNENDDIVGMIDIRHRLNNSLMNFGGHIGYSVIRPQRQKGIATRMLALALDECMKLNIFKVLITCDKENVASAKTIMNNGGILENEIQEENRVTQRYWIEL
ncbi:MAG: GNAT family N-acetyltransferase [Angelakisella sp.]